MHSSPAIALFAVHIGDGVLQFSWLAGGFAFAALGIAFGLWRLRDEEIPRIALLTAAFFVASSIHIRIGPTSWHLLLNGLVGVLLGRRAGLAIPLGLTLQYFLLMHGGLSTLGVNTCILLLPALLAAALFQGMRNAAWLQRPWFRGGLIGLSLLAWLLSSVYSVTLLVSNSLGTSRRPDLEAANNVTFHPLVLAGAVAVALGAGWYAQHRRVSADFALGLVVGEASVLATIMLNCAALLLGGEANWTLTAEVLLVLHLPIAVLEGIMLGFLVSFVGRVQPGLLDRPVLAATVPGRAAHAVSSAAVLAEPAAADLAGAGPPDVRQVSGVAGQAYPDKRLLRH